MIKAENKPIRLMVADDDVNIRRMLETLIEVTEDIELVAQATQGAEAVRACVLYQPDVVLMDIQMPLMNGLEAIRTICRLAPKTRVIVYSVNADRISPKLILESGAVGYLEKTAPIATVLRAIRNAHARIAASGSDLGEISNLVLAKTLDDWVKEETMDTPTDKVPYHKIRRIHKTNQSGQANELLKAGWILLETEKSQVGPNSYDTSYILGYTEEVEDPESGEEYRLRKLQEIIDEL
jgi:DNA-binding NarL/FixJ family response regulator